jgi:hypothetical protein
LSKGQHTIFHHEKFQKKLSSAVISKNEIRLFERWIPIARKIVTKTQVAKMLADN